MKILNKNRKEKIILAVGAVIYFLLIFLNEIFFALEYMFKKSKKNTYHKADLKQKTLTKHSTYPFYIPSSNGKNKEGSSNIAIPKKPEIQEPIPLHIYRFNKFKNYQ